MADELAGQQQPAHGVLPADEGFERFDPPGAKVERRLVVEDELVEQPGAAELTGQRQPGLRLGQHARRERADGAAARCLRRIHREVGVAQDRVGVGAGRDAGAGGGMHVIADQAMRAGHRLERAPRDRGRVFIAEREDRELVAAQARDEIAGTQRGAKALRGAGEKLVAGRVAEAVVDRLEVVEIEEHERGGPVRGERSVELGHQARPVRKAGELVGPGQGLQLLLGFAPACDVEPEPLNRHRPPVVAAHERGLVEHPDRMSVSMHHPVLARVPGAVRIGVADERENPFPVVRMQRRHEQVRIRHPLLGRIAEEYLDLPARVEVRGVVGSLVDVDDEWQMLDELLEGHRRALPGHVGRSTVPILRRVQPQPRREGDREPRHDPFRLAAHVPDETEHGGGAHHERARR